MAWGGRKGMEGKEGTWEHWQQRATAQEAKGKEQIRYLNFLDL